jgi:hypothetical protein
MDRISDAFFGSGITQATEFQKQTDAVVSSQADIWLIIEGFFKTYGHDFIILGLAGICVLYVLLKIYQKRSSNLELLYGSIFIISSLFAVALMSGKFIIQEFIRSFNFALVIAPIIIAVVCSTFFSTITTKKWKIVFLVCVTFLVCTAGFFGIFRVYNDAWFGDKNTQMSFKDKYGTEWFLDNYSPDVSVVTNRWDFRAWTNYHLAMEEIRQPKLAKNLPAHFGYYSYSSINDFFKDSQHYMITHEVMLFQDVGVPKNRLWRIADRLFSKEDFERLNLDSGVDKLFTTNGFDVWYLH